MKTWRVATLALLLCGVVTGVFLWKFAGVFAQAEDPKAAPDKIPVVAALNHFRALRKLWVRGSTSPTAELIVSNSYNTSTGLISAVQLRGYDWLPEEARLDMEHRAVAREPFPIYTWPPFVRIVDPNDHPMKHWWDFKKYYPGSKCEVTLWPAGYTRDGTRAIITFGFGPTAHGAMAVYLLQHRRGLWYVVRYSVLYFV